MLGPYELMQCGLWGEKKGHQYNLQKNHPCVISSPEYILRPLLKVLQCWAPQYESDMERVESPARAHQDAEGTGASLPWGEAGRAGAAQPGAGQAQGSHPCV